MKTLHDIRGTLPYEHLPVLTAAEYLRLRDQNWLRGGIEDMWIEGGFVLGNWRPITDMGQPRADSQEYIVNMNANYEERHRRTWLIEDLGMFRAYRNRDEYASHYLDRDSAMQARPGGNFETFSKEDTPDPEENNEGGEFDDDEEDEDG